MMPATLLLRFLRFSRPKWFRRSPGNRGFVTLILRLTSPLITRLDIARISRFAYTPLT